MGQIKRKFYGVMVFTGADAAGLPAIPDVLPEVRNPLDLPLVAGSKSLLEDRVQRTIDWLSRHRRVLNIESPVIKTIEQRSWSRPRYTALIQADFAER